MQKSPLILLTILMGLPGCLQSHAEQDLASSLKGDAAGGVVLLYGGEVSLAHPYAQHVTTMLKSLAVPFSDAKLSVETLASEPCQNELVIMTDLAAFKALPPSAQEEFAARCSSGNSRWIFLYAGIQAGSFRGLVIDAASVEAAEPRILAAFAEPSFLRVPTKRIEGSLPGYCRVLNSAPQDLWHPIVVARVLGSERAVVMSAGGGPESASLPRTLVFGCDILPSATIDLLLADSLGGWSTSRSAERYVAIDIDDVFQPNWNNDSNLRTVKMQADDAAELLAVQGRLSRIFAGEFQFTLGFNALWYQAQVGPTTTDDAAGDGALVRNRVHFRWFDHLFGHEGAPDYPYAELLASMTKNRAWAEEHDVTSRLGSYAVSPAHRGTLPPYEPLYQAWRETGIDATTTFDLRPGAKAQRHQGVTVARRFGCEAACYSDQYSFEQLPKETLEQIASSVVVPTVVSNPAVIFMSHQSDYARDRVGAYVFERAFENLREWTTLRFINLPSEEVVGKYVEIFGVEDI